MAIWHGGRGREPDEPAICHHSVTARADELGPTSSVLPVAEGLCGRVDADRFRTHEPAFECRHG